MKEIQMNPLLPNNLASNIYIDFESLYDLRLATVALINPSAAAQMLTMEKYKVRLIDDFSLLDLGIQDHEYRRAYAQRNIDTLLLAPMTELMMQLRTHVMEEIRKVTGVMTAEESSRPKIIINYWPFSELTPTEVDAFRDCIRVHAGGWFEYEMICTPPTELNMYWWRDQQIGLGFIYDYSQWDRYLLTGVDTENIPTIPQTQLIFFQRALNLDRLKEQLEYKTDTGATIDPFMAETNIRSLFIGVRWTGSDIFSAADINLHLKQ